MFIYCLTSQESEYTISISNIKSAWLIMISISMQKPENGDRYPLWWTDIEIDIQPSLESGDCQRVEYKYVRFDANVSYRISAV